ncbi:hypothetical protein KKA03_03015, partial [archaeon]|nr:hypothetical protein [archaeon]
MIDSQTYFWVFSTIIQAFAALVALIGMFVVFRLQIIKSEIESSYRDLSAFFRKNLSKDQLESHIDYDIIKFEKEIEKRQEEIEEGPTQGRRIQLKAQIEDFEEEIEDRRRRINLIYSHKSESEAIIKKSKPIFYHNAFLISLS